MNLLFDLDGTLTDSRPGITASIEYALVKLGLPVPAEDELTALVGPPLHVTFSKLLPDPNKKNVAEAIGLYRERFADEGIFENSVYPGIVDILKEFSGMGAGLYVATSKPHVFADRIVEHFEIAQYFRGVFGSELDGTHTDKTELIAHLMETEKLRDRFTTMVGDRSHDIKGGQDNNLQTVGVAWGYGTKKEL